MVILWTIGTFGSMSGCSQIGYLRGSSDLPEKIDRMLSDEPGDSTGGLDPTRPLVRTGLIREKARLEALAEHHRRAFPFALAQTMLGGMLVVSALSVMTRRRGWRTLALQFVGAHAAFVVAAHVGLSPVREAMVGAVAAELARQPTAREDASGDLPPLVRSRDEVEAADVHALVLQLAAFGFAALALTRPRTKAYFGAAAPPRDDIEPDGT